MSSQPDQPTPQGIERLVLWHRATTAFTAETQTLGWRKRVALRLGLAGGAILARVGGNVAASFDPLELDDVIDLALGLLGDSGIEVPQLAVTCALTLGELFHDEDGGAPAGDALDRAQILSCSASASELVLDEPTHARAKDTHLFVRSMGQGPQSGHVLDAQNPTQRACRRALSALHAAPLPVGTRPTFELLRALALRPGPTRIALSAPQLHAALDWIERLRSEIGPSLLLHVGPQAAGLQPLGGIQLALRREHNRLHGELDAALRVGITRFLEGAALSREEAVVALRELLRQASATGQRSWIVLEQPREVDQASVAVVAEALARQGSDHVLWLLADQDARVPRVLLGAGAYEAVAIGPLAERDRAQVAEAVLGLPAGSELARRIGVLGGDTALGVVEAARTLVGSGDLVVDAGVFRWRTQARGGSLPIPVDALLTERAAGLGPSAKRVLEALCITPASAPPGFVERITSLDGMSAEAAAVGLTELRRESWIDEQGSLGPLEHSVRSAVRNGMPPSRAAELHRFVAEALGAEATLGRGPSFAHALLAHHLAEGGREREAAGAWLDAAQAASDCGFPRMAVRLAALALELDGSTETRQRAGRVAGTIDSTPLRDSAPLVATHGPAPEPAEQVAADTREVAATSIASAVAAVARGEVDAAESLIDTAMAAGWGRAGAQRLWAVAQLRRGDVPEAVRALKRAHAPTGSPGTRSREAIAAALILLESGDGLDAVRAGLEALAGARRIGDRRGEHVALCVLSSCYRALGRDHEAERIATAAETAASA